MNSSVNPPRIRCSKIEDFHATNAILGRRFVWETACAPAGNFVVPVPLPGRRFTRPRYARQEERMNNGAPGPTQPLPRIIRGLPEKLSSYVFNCVSFYTFYSTDRYCSFRFILFLFFFLRVCANRNFIPRPIFFDRSLRIFAIPRLRNFRQRERERDDLSWEICLEIEDIFWFWSSMRNVLGRICFARSMERSEFITVNYRVPVFVDGESLK